jgi:hypothetical protein
VNGRRTYAFAEDVGTLTVPGEKNVNADCNKHAASTLADGSPGVHQVCDVPMQHEYLWCGGARVRHSTSHCDYLRMKIVAVPSHVYSRGAQDNMYDSSGHGICPLFCPLFARRSRYKYHSFVPQESILRPPSTSTMPTNNQSGKSYTVTSSGTNSQVSVAQLSIYRPLMNL